MKVYIIGLHDESWGNHGDYITHVFTDYNKAREQADWLENNLSLLDGDYVTYEEFDISEEVDHHGKEETICGYMYSYDEDES